MTSIELESEFQEEEEQPKKRFVMTKANICTARPNSIEVPNHVEGYANFFSLGGTVSKMDVKTTKRYIKFKKRDRDYD